MAVTARLNELDGPAVMRTAAAATSVLLVILVAVAAARLTWQLVPQPAARPVPAATTGVGGAGERAPRVDLEQVADLHLFGQPRAAAPVARAAPVEAPETRLNLTLRGVFVSDDDRAVALIAAPGKPDRPYRVGDAVPGGATLHQVLADRVLLERGGRYETLRLPRERVGEAGGEPAPRELTAAPAAFDPQTAAALGNYRQQVLRNPTEAWKVVRMQPVMEGGRLKGYKLSPGRDPKLFREVGLTPGDVVTSVNGIALDDPSGLGRLVDQVSNAERLALTVQNNGAERRVELQFGR